MEVQFNGMNLFPGFHTMTVNSCTWIGRDTIVSGGEDTTLKTFSTSAPRSLQPFQHIQTERLHLSSIKTIYRTENLLITAGGVFSMAFWLIIEGKLKLLRFVFHRAKKDCRILSAVAWRINPCDSKFAVVSSSSDAALWLGVIDISTGQYEEMDHTFDLDSPSFALCHVTGNVIASGGNNGMMTTYNANLRTVDGRIRLSLAVKDCTGAHTSGIHALVSVPCVKSRKWMMASAGDDEKVAFYCVNESGSIEKSVALHAHHAAATGKYVSVPMMLQPLLLSYLEHGDFKAYACIIRVLIHAERTVEFTDGCGQRKRKSCK